MHDTPDYSVRELGLTRLRLRGDLVFTPRTSGGETYYMVEDPLNSRFFRLGHAEYTLVSLLNGRTSIQEALSRLSTVMPHHRLSEADAGGLCRWLVEMDLAHTTESSRATRLAESADRLKQRQLLVRWNPLVFRQPLVQPDRWFVPLTSWFGWLYSPISLVGWLVAVAVGAYHVLSAWDRFAASAQGIFAPNNWLWLAACWVVLKLVHETSHGIVCKRYGGTVGEMGILFILFAPLAYVDVTSSWRFRSRLQRIHVAVAGMYIELLIAAVAAIVWSHTDTGWLNNLCFNVIVMASITTLLFNANPLMKFDGYYVLSDALAMPNLYVNGQQFLRYFARRYLLGTPATLPHWPRGRGAAIRVFGVASFAWRLMVCASLTVAATTMFHGAGVVLAGLAVLMWIGVPTFRFMKYLVAGQPGEQPNRLRFLLTAGSASAACVTVLGFVPWPGASKAPAVVTYSPDTVVRADSAGFVRQILVKSGQCVEQGQLLAVLENRELSRDVADLDLAIRQSEIRGFQHEQKGELAAQQAEMDHREALQSQLAEKRAQLQQLSVRAPRAGKIVRRDVSVLLGSYLKAGDEIVSIGDEHQKELRVSVAQNDLDVFRQRAGKLVRVDLPGHSLWDSRLTKVIPRATLEPTHPALVAANGGTLSVHKVTQGTDDTSEAAYELFEPRFTGIVRLSETESQKLHAGQCGGILYRPWDQSIGEHLYFALSNWIRERLGKPS